MLKVTVNGSEDQTTLVLEGKLMDPWLPEARRAWDEVRNNIEARQIVIDLKDVTAISEKGQEFLREVMAKGAKFNCCRGILTKHVVRRLVHRFRAHSRAKEVKE